MSTFKQLNPFELKTAITELLGKINSVSDIQNCLMDFEMLDAQEDKKIISKVLFKELITSGKEKTPVIIVRSNDMEIALLIDKINELFEVPEDKIVNSGEGYFLAEFIYNDTPYTILNIEKIFTDKKIVVTDM